MTTKRKRKLPDLDDLLQGEPKTRVRLCDHPGCREEGTYRAPKNRQLSDYYWFCLPHVQAYNKSWNFYDGLSEAALEAEIRSSTVWDRPTWPLGEKGPNAVRGGGQAVNDPFEFFDPGTERPKGRGAERRGRRIHTESRVDGPRARALRILDLDDPVSPEDVKARYKVLVKQTHPDVNGGDPAAEERFKMVNEAYRVLTRPKGK